jgi:hypothetical protein
MADRSICVELDIPVIAQATRDDVTDVNKIRRYVARMGGTLPGDIELDVTEYDTNAFYVKVFEQPNLAEPLPATRTD